MTGVEPERTVAVSVRTVPEATLLTGAPDAVTARAVMPGCDEAKRGTVAKEAVLRLREVFSTVVSGVYCNDEKEFRRDARFRMAPPCCEAPWL